MKNIRRRFKLINILMAVLLILISIPCHSSHAAMISTEDVANSKRALDARKSIADILAREEIQSALIRQGINPMEAKARIDSLTDMEAIQLANRIDQVPAGGGALGALIGAALVVFIVLVITDIIGVTDVFPFIKSKNKE